tara:strand:- start:1042 stop:1233 length:192 start_codon:yes stop_codon:yes gene_type:complete
MDTFRVIIAIVGGLLVIFAIADFGSSYMGYNLTPFLPDGIARFSPIIIGGIGGLFIKIGSDSD